MSSLDLELMIATAIVTIKQARLNDFVEENARETAKRQRDHYDYWYRILDEQSRENSIVPSCFMMLISLRMTQPLKSYSGG